MVATTPKTQGSVRRPRFFKVLMGDFAQRLKIPQNFVKHISKEASDRVIIHDPSGRSWRVGLLRTPKGTFLSGGWPNFVNDHALKENEFLVFQYNGNMHFSVLLFDTSACEKEDVPELQSVSYPCFVKEEIDDEATKCLLDANKLQEQNKIESEVEELPFVSPEASKKTQGPGCSMYRGRHISSAKEHELVEVKVEDDDIPVDVRGLEIKNTKARQLLKVENRVTAAEAAYSFRSIFPYFVSCMTASSIRKSYSLRLPTRFAREYLPRKRTKVVLRVSDGTALIVVHVPGTTNFFSAGWAAFVRANNLRIGDFCVFELVDPAEFRVNFFRVLRLRDNK